MANAAVRRPAPSGLYDQDFHEWTQEQARALRERRFADLDIENIAEELETLGRRERSEIRSRLKVLLTHLLKWRYQPDKRSNSWRGTLEEQRYRLKENLGENPSLRSYPAQILAHEYKFARYHAADETGLPLEHFPETCPFSLEDILSDSLPH